MITAIRRFAAIYAVIATTILSCTKDTTIVPDESTNPQPQQPAPPASADISETKPAIQTAVNININANCGGFYKAVPARYDSTNKKYPLLVFIHGIGELGNGNSDLQKLLNTPIPSRLKNKTFPVKFTVNNQEFSFIVISPQFKAWPSPNDIDAVVKYASQNLRVDPARIYVIGLSMGGGATWEYGAAFASKVAAIAPICGASSPDINRAKKIAAANLPVWAFHNADDPTVTVNNTNNYVANINAQKPAIPAIKTIWPTGGHNAWSKATDPNYKENGVNVYEWMLKYKR